jgi:hypothetical protein
LGDELLNLEEVIVNQHWKQEIEDSWKRFMDWGYVDKYLREDITHYLRHTKAGQNFLDAIWDMSKNAFDCDREVQVVIDSNNKLFITFGTAGFVWFHDSEEVTGMQMPIKCWIHTHPFGKAYFSGTDWDTINTYEPIMDSAIVLGGTERMTWIKEKTHTHFENFVPLNKGTET